MQRLKRSDSWKLNQRVMGRILLRSTALTFVARKGQIELFGSTLLVFDRVLNKSVAGSTGQRNESLQPISGCFKIQGFTW
ncbi:hypothetical protein ACKJSM_17760, partial [Pseudomonas sp. PHC1]|uniref:hypothetical protein n=1 Tax=Pseudomonas sp. PHC1 TaxID=3384759 RepID=UPI00396F5A3E